MKTRLLRLKHEKIVLRKGTRRVRGGEINWFTIQLMLEIASN